MSQALGLDVIAEGVETEEQVKFLHDSGCNHYQGYLFGKPMAIEQFEESLFDINPEPRLAQASNR